LINGQPPERIIMSKTIYTKFIITVEAEEEDVNFKMFSLEDKFEPVEEELTNLVENLNKRFEEFDFTLKEEF
jgi:chaperonin cofactor prefoldin